MLKTLTFAITFLLKTCFNLLNSTSNTLSTPCLLTSVNTLVKTKSILGLTKGFNIATTVIVALLAPIFNSDIAYSFQSVLPYYTSIVTKTANYPLVGVIFQAMYGVVMLFAPTSLVLMSILAYLKVSYKDWLKTIWKLLLELFVVLLIIFIILALI